MKPSWSRSKLWPEAPKPGALGAVFHLLGLGVPVAPSSSSGKAFLFAHLSTLRQLDPSQPAPPGSETSSFPAGSREYSCVYMTLGRGRVTDDLNSGGLLVSEFCFKHRILLYGFGCPEFKNLPGAGMEDGCTPPCPVRGSSHATRAGTESLQSALQS